MSDASDTQLLAQAIQQQDPSAFAQLFDRYKNESFNLALHLTHNAALAEDAVQDAMLAVWQLKKIPESGARKWLLAIVAHKSLQMIRSRKRSSQREERLSGMGVNQTLSTPDTKHEREELIRALRTHMENLPTVERQMLALYFGAEISETEIGKMLSLSQTSVSRKLSEALTRLRTNLAAAGFAAAVPLVALKGLNQALLTGQQAPQSLSVNVLNALKTRPAAASQKLSKGALKTAGKSMVGPIIAATTFAVAVGVASYATFSKPATTVVAAVQTPSKPAIAVQPKFWSFQTGPASDLSVYNGTWDWKKSGASGAMYAPADHTVIVPLPLQAGNTPMLVEVIRNGIGRSGAGCVNTLRTKDDHFLKYTEYVKRVNIAVNSSSTRSYIFGRYIVSMHGNQISGVVEVPEADPSDYLCLLVQNFTVESISVRTIDPSEIPAEVRDAQAVIKQLDVPAAYGRNSELTYLNAPR